MVYSCLCGKIIQSINNNTRINCVFHILTTVNLCLAPVLFIQDYQNLSLG